MGTALTIFYCGAAVVGVFLLGQVIYYTWSTSRLTSRDPYVVNKEFHRVMGFDGKYPSRREILKAQAEFDQLMAEFRKVAGD